MFYAQIFNQYVCSLGTEPVTFALVTQSVDEQEHIWQQLSLKQINPY